VLRIGGGVCRRASGHFSLSKDRLDPPGLLRKLEFRLEIESDGAIGNKRQPRLVAADHEPFGVVPENTRRVEHALLGFLREVHKQG
jgi:hypothetical protein